MKDRQTSKEEKNEHAVIVCSIIGRRGSGYYQFECRIYFTPYDFQIETMIAKTLNEAIAAFKIKYPNAYYVEEV